MVFLLLHLFIQPVIAAEPFPYSTRTRNYSGWSSTIQGDVNALGMGGATVAFPSSIAAAQINPAGFAMVTASLSAQIVKNTKEDLHVQKSSNQSSNQQWGLGVNPSPWGFGILYYTPTTENGNYQSPNTGNNLETEITVKEVRIAVAHAFFENKFSIGASFGIAKAFRTLGPYEFNETSFDFEVGVLYCLPQHFILGASFIPQNTIQTSDSKPLQNEMPGFDQHVIVPAQTTAGVAWVPNRFFKTGFSLTYVSTIPNAGLLSDQSKTVGAYPILQPRLGASYVLAEYPNFKIEYAFGGYFEPSRIAGESNRLHGTMGLEVQPWFINTGIGFDLASNYKNVMLGLTIDIVRTARALEIIPPDPVPPYGGFFPPMFRVMADGLPAGMTKGEPSSAAPPNLGEIQEIIYDIPKRIKNRIKKTEKPEN